MFSVPWFRQSPVARFRSPVAESELAPELSVRLTFESLPESAIPSPRPNHTPPPVDPVPSGMLKAAGIEALPPRSRRS